MGGVYHVKRFTVNLCIQITLTIKLSSKFEANSNLKKNGSKLTNHDKKFQICMS